jgi:hypothetical protein
VVKAELIPCLPFHLSGIPTANSTISNSQTAIYAQGVGLGASKGRELGKYTEGYSGYVNMVQDAVSDVECGDEMEHLGNTEEMFSGPRTLWKLNLLCYHIVLSSYSMFLHIWNCLLCLRTRSSTKEIL